MSQQRPTAYEYRRMVRYGDCDASLNYYTPRAIDYAVEAIEGWFEQVVGVSWSDLVTLHGMELHFLHAGCEFRKALTAGETVLAHVVVSVEHSILTFSISGVNQAGELCFRTTLTSCFVERRQFKQIPIPPEYGERIERYRASCGAAGPVEEAGCPVTADRNVPLPLAGGAGEVPFILQRRVVYGECGVSGTIYLPRVFDYLLEANGEWYGKFLGISWMEQNILKRGQPFLQVTCDILSRVVSGQLISLIFTVSRLGRSSISYTVQGYDGKGAHCISGQLTACYSVEQNGALKATPFPDELRGKITAYQAACDEYSSSGH
ncbi:acyl-CoA thioesterase [Geobacter argillaceus]|uniref:Acyl-CoA thioesterase FadM n=1 Tax=Geobacter argillaceus TaxID=345631 RepID=A0A562VHU6_9BACT|nr:acyl-CoA thioesterase [Geobacter argillaceus]TWJ17354.1 acyl-CoA thioesterase FadM [Geobacter argillaceus]